MITTTRIQSTSVEITVTKRSPKRILATLFRRRRRRWQKWQQQVATYQDNNKTETTEGDDANDDKTLLEHNTMPSGRQQNEKTGIRKKVGFDETANTTFSNNSNQDNWYSEAEILVFHQQFYELIRTLRVEHKYDVVSSSSSSWIRHLRRVYQSFCLAQQQEPFVGSQSKLLDDFTLGAERWAVPMILKDVQTRRERLYRVSRRFSQPDALAQTCRAISLPSRLYARYLADQVTAVPSVDY